MALVSQVIALEPRYTPYRRPPQDMLISSAVPRGLRSFVSPGIATEAKPINDDYLLSFTWTLSAGFGYIVNELHVNIVIDKASDFDAIGHWRLSGSSPANRGFDYRIPFDFDLFSQNGLTREVRSSSILSGQLTRTPIVPFQTTGSNQSISITNRVDTAQLAGTADCVISFWEYDLAQIEYYMAHSALNTLGR